MISYLIFMVALGNYALNHQTTTLLLQNWHALSGMLSPGSLLEDINVTITSMVGGIGRKVIVQ